MAGVEIRKATLNDAYEYAACKLSSWQAAYKNIIPDDYLNSLSINEEIEKFTLGYTTYHDYSYYCAFYKNSLIGIFVIGKSRDEDKPTCGEICAIYLLPKFWNRGYGKTMMNYAINVLKTQGYNEIILWVLDENSRAKYFYENCSFTFDGTQKEIHIGKPLLENRYVLKI